MYDVLPVVGQEEINFIKRIGEPEAESWSLAMGKLGKQKGSMSSEIAQMAEKLYDIVFQNPNRLIMSEKHIVENPGIKVRCVPASVFYHGKTGRVSVAWVIHTASADEAMKLAMIAPPNDVKKRGILQDWLRSIPEDVRKVQAELVRSGIEAEKWWIG
jgi:transcriptional/translational regulatory protein YebC/TACO1